MNLTLLETDSLFSQLTQIVNVFAGQIRENEVVKIYEIPWFIIRTKNKLRKITFFGDGEILFRDVDAVHVTCHKRFLSVMVTE